MATLALSSFLVHLSTSPNRPIRAPEGTYWREGRIPADATKGKQVGSLASIKSSLCNHEAATGGPTPREKKAQ